MDYEKKYNEAKNKAIEQLSSTPMDKAALYYIFPELRESEDERIRKWLVDYFSSIKETVWIHRDITCEQILAYLEKQKINTEGDFGRGYDCGYQAGYAVAMNEMKPKVATATLATLDSEKQKEIPMPNSTELIEMWHNEEAMLKEKDFRGDTWRIAYNAFLDGFAQGMMVKQKEQKSAEEQDYSGLTDLERAIHRGFLVAGVENVPVTIIKETAKDCLAHMPAEWSEEDKNKMDVIIRLVEQNSGWPDRAIKEYVNWLKSLRPSWKPTEEHLSALLAVFNDPDNIGSQTCQLALTDLYEQLKKL